MLKPPQWGAVGARRSTTSLLPDWDGNKAIPFYGTRGEVAAHCWLWRRDAGHRPPHLPYDGSRPGLCVPGSRQLDMGNSGLNSGSSRPTLFA